MFMGEYTHSIDAKGRIILPADFRQELGVSFVITKGLDKCLFLYGQQAWEELAAKLRALPLVKPEARAIVRFFFSGARTLECDKQGRFLIPANLRNHAEIVLKEDVILTGVDNRIEVWSKDNWNSYSSEVEPDVTSIAASLAELGI
ncbi:MAG: division/cell wall cluster transcriptional repressor MraZ [Selenomonas sp.]|jgi:MraZ protein|uniref:division/cell wall cluster transcriptional repressor MraZ n=1 Tax=Selenomonas sp. AE3005 TaxID=1485543 RepID=UPI000482788A|nr:division/cell wall cluster transcriptional repressor MraZ [Selenomonas sp. AE3005]MBQ1415765.1 division/cell wall cluster transcriptional repressor MraZ [Selenomonas sp.]MBQ1461491.1 division/cell wall cluster transcriptional repressor MraZ [Selenomonas sp.]MBQ1614666.1 division/cell wall cluster transcriptional repressor MraZ [Selenomonas sp.]MBQ1919780.1 division/cell wall cluster transcriptional repressor MraZ [Selenomonas sp.]MBQ2088320.1 division/cell wall cluster transcriptional repre